MVSSFRSLISFTTYHLILLALTVPILLTHRHILPNPPTWTRIATEAATIDLLDAPDTLKLHNASIRTKEGNSSCIIVGCHTPGTPGSLLFWNYYTRLGYTTTLVTFSRVTHNGNPTSPFWCAIPTVLRAQRRVPSARVLAINMDTLVDARAWCDMRSLGRAAPIVMNSLFRRRRLRKQGLDVWGTQIQANAFIAERGDVGRRAVKRWERGFVHAFHHDQAVVHRQEGEVCGVPGWVACHRNPHDQHCHCTNIAREKEEECIEELFAGRRAKCTLYEEIHGKQNQGAKSRIQGTARKSSRVNRRDGVEKTRKIYRRRTVRKNRSRPYGGNSSRRRLTVDK